MVSPDSYPAVSRFQLRLHLALTSGLISHFVYRAAPSRLPAAASIVRMFDVGESLREAAESARTRLRDAQAAVARANAGGEAGRGADAAMAATAKAALFSEALLAAQRARFEEIKAVAK